MVVKAASKGTQKDVKIRWEETDEGEWKGRMGANKNKVMKEWM